METSDQAQLVKHNHCLPLPKVATYKPTGKVGASTGAISRQHVLVQSSSAANKKDVTPQKDFSVGEATSPVGVQPGVNGWAVVKNRKGTRNRPIIVGTAEVEEVSVIKAVPKRAHLRIFRLHPATEDKDLKAHLINMGIHDCVVEKLQTPFNDYASYRVTIPFGTSIQRFFFPRVEPKKRPNW